MRWALVCFFVFTSSCCVAQYYETYSPANGLVDARVSRIIQDGSGRIFFLTRDGLSIYDGQRFTNHTRLSGSPVGMIIDGMLMPDGSLQLLSFDGYWIHASKKNIVADTGFLPKIPEASAILSLPGNEKLFISNNGLFVYKNNPAKDTRQFRPPGMKISPLDKFAASGNYLVFNYYQYKSKYIYLWDINREIITDSLPTPVIHSMLTDKEGRIQVCTVTGLLQLNKTALEQGKLQMERPWFGKFIPAGFPVQNIFFDRQENIWFINDLGCRQVDPRNGNIHSYTSANGLLTGINSIFQDRENNYWFIAYGKGVQKLMQTNYEIVTRIGEVAIETVFSSNTSEDGSLFLFTNKNMIAFKNDRAQEFALAPQLFTNPVFYWQKNYWTYASPDRLVNNEKKYIPLGDSSLVSRIAHFPSPHVNTDPEGNLLLAGNLITVIKKDLSAHRQPLPYFADNIVTDEKNNFWAFCRSNDIVKFSFRDNQLIKQASFLYPGIEPRFAIHWNLDTFWIASRQNGILIAKITDRSFTVIGKLTRENGLSNDFVETLLKIDGQRVAAGTASGLDIITLAGTDTLIANVSSRINHFEPILQLSRDDKGMIFARTENLQLFRYDPFTTTSPDYDPAAWISKITVNDLAIDTSITTFNYLQNNFLFSVTSPSFTDSRSIIFSFTLSGEKKVWQQHSNKADFSISNLPPGSYQLTVVVKYPGRIYPDKRIGYHFTIRLPFWKTWWFISGILLLILLTAWYFIRDYWERKMQRQKMIMEKELAIEQERTRMARELHDGLGSMLSGVKHSFSAMKNELDMKGTEEEKFNYNIGKLNDSIKELRNISHSMAPDSLLKYGLENSLRDYCQHISQSGELDISFEALSTTDMYLNEEQSFHIFRIVQELLQNIIIHAGARHAIIQLSYNNKRLYLTVEDDGNGFELNDPHLKKGMGLKNIESRVNILKGRMDYQTAPAKGTSVLIEIPCEEKK
ncbi:MAG TPA: ATP-binding protein [Chitinophagaceae bacterium]|jgi:signal transduction histidine kinase|nr:ATP-binding protein [Chitinophagaceae bacterium]